MAYSVTYGRLTIPDIEDDEPVFILRAEDGLAESAIEMYRLLAEAHGCPIGPAVEREIRHFREWQRNKKLPVSAGEV